MRLSTLSENGTDTRIVVRDSLPRGQFHHWVVAACVAQEHQIRFLVGTGSYTSSNATRFPPANVRVWMYSMFRAMEPPSSMGPMPKWPR